MVFHHNFFFQLFSILNWFLVLFLLLFSLLIALVFSPILGFFRNASSGVFNFATEFYYCFLGVFILSLLFFCQVLGFCVVALQVLRIWENFFYSQMFFYLTLLPTLTKNRKCYKFDRVFLLSGLFYSTIFPDIWDYLLLPSRLSWELAVLCWRLQGL